MWRRSRNKWSKRISRKRRMSRKKSKSKKMCRRRATHHKTWLLKQLNIKRSKSMRLPLQSRTSRLQKKLRKPKQNQLRRNSQSKNMSKSHSHRPRQSRLLTRRRCLKLTKFSLDSVKTILMKLCRSRISNQRRTWSGLRTPLSLFLQKTNKLPAPSHQR